MIHIHNAKDPIDSKEDGMVIEVSSLQPSIALPPIDAIFNVIFTVFKPTHCWWKNFFARVGEFHVERVRKKILCLARRLHG